MQDEKIPLTDEFCLAANESDQGGGGGFSDLPTRLQRYEEAHSRALLMADYATLQGENKLSLKLAKCGHYLVFRHYYTEDKLKLHAADFCKKHLLCPFCAIRRGAKYLKAYTEKLEIILQDNPNLKAYLVTLTVKNGVDLMERFRHMRKALSAMTQARRAYLNDSKNRQHIEFAKTLGGIHSIELKRGKNSNAWHPHVHMIWLCETEPDQYKLSAEWKNLTGDSYIVDVRPFHNQGDMIGGFLEVFKYALKFSELELSDNWEAFEKLTGKRLIDAFGLFRGVEVSDDLTDGVLHDLPYLELFFEYCRGEYQFRAVKNA